MKIIQQMMVEHAAVSPEHDAVIMPQVIKPKFKLTSSCPIPLCIACKLLQATKRNPGVTTQPAVKEKEGILSAEQYKPGDFVSMDQYISKTPGRLPIGYGQEGPDNKYHGGTIFNDALSGIINVENQVWIGAGETIASKLRFEQ